jgi:hypothetical protein
MATFFGIRGASLSSHLVLAFLLDVVFVFVCLLLIVEKLLDGFKTTLSTDQLRHLQWRVFYYDLSQL